MRFRSVLVAVLVAGLEDVAFAQPMLRVPDDSEGWPFGLCVHNLVADDGPATDALDEVGVPWVRVDFNWPEIERSEGSLDWSLTDRVVDNARAHGYVVYPTLAYTPAWATDGPEIRGVPRSADYYRNFVRAVVERYRDRVKHWGLWNEPEQDTRFWTGTPAQFVDLVLRPGFEAVRVADPDALVLGPDSGDDDWLDGIFAAGGGAYLDVITVHVYACCDGTDNVAKVLRRLDCTGAWPWETCRRRVIERHGLGDKPVWLTETGWKTLTPDWEPRQAEYYVGLLDAMLARSSWWRKTIFYELWDATPCDPGADNCWGITRNDWSQKPSFDALRTYIVAHQPRADAGPDLDAEPGVAVALDGSASVDPDGSIVRFRWDFDRADGVYAQAEGARVEHAYPAPGTYVATLVVTDSHALEDGDTVVVVVRDGVEPPDAGADGDAGADADADAGADADDAGSAPDADADGDADAGGDPGADADACEPAACGESCRAGGFENGVCRDTACICVPAGSGDPGCGCAVPGGRPRALAWLVVAVALLGACSAGPRAAACGRRKR